MLAASDFASSLISIVFILAAGAIGGFWWCRRQANK